MNKKVIGRWQDNPPPSDTSLMIADPPYEMEIINELVYEIVFENIPSIMFMYPENICTLPRIPHQICHWVKPISTKNTMKNYSNFVEAIAMWNVKMNGDLHWSNRTGIFTDALIEKSQHPHKKPESLIQRLILNHYQGKGCIYDPCAGTFTVDSVCRKLGIPSFSVEKVHYGQM